MQIYHLPSIENISSSVDIIEVSGLRTIRIQHPFASAAISLYGGQLLSSQPKGKNDLLWLSSDAILDGSTPIRGGIPVCFPWFGRIASPAHGFARTETWEIASIQEDESKLTIELALTATNSTLSIWPYHFEAKLSFEIEQDIKVRLFVKNMDYKPFQFSAALHSYLNVGDIQNCKVHGLGSTYLDSLACGEKRIGKEILSINEAIDRIYLQPASTITIEDHNRERVLSITNSNHNSAVVWNPWLTGAESTPDINSTQFTQFVCIESCLYASSLEQGKTLAPGESYELSTKIASS